MDIDRCVVCGDVIPEGRQVCPTCIGMNRTECDPIGCNRPGTRRNGPGRGERSGRCLNTQI